MTYAEFRVLLGARWSIENKSSDHQRMGQFAWNYLYEVRPDICRLIMAGPKAIDPFYDDSRIPAFFKFVEENW